MFFQLLLIEIEAEHKNFVVIKIQSLSHLNSPLKGEAMPITAGFSMSTDK